MASCCGGNQAALQALYDARLMDMPPAFQAVMESPVEPGDRGIKAPVVVRMEFVGEQFGSTTWKSKDGQRTYRGGREPGYRFADVAEQDVEHLTLTGVWRRV